MTLDFNFNKIKTLFLIGAGGTGGYLIPKLFRHIHTIERLRSNLKIYIVDPDIVEERNIGRQNFGPGDVGMAKAKVMALRYGSMFDLDVKYFVEKADWDKYNVLCLDNTLIIDTVDNKSARKEIDKYIKGLYKDVGWISAGNSQDDGQVVIYPPSRALYDKRTVVDVWPDNFSDEEIEAERQREEEANCAINAQINPQSMAANDTSATIIYNICHQAIHQKEIKYDIIFFTVFNEITKIECGEDPFGSLDENAAQSIVDKLEVI